MTNQKLNTKKGKAKLKDRIPFTLRLPKDIHTLLEDLSEQKGMTLQGYLLFVLEKHLENPEFTPDEVSPKRESGQRVPFTLRFPKKTHEILETLSEAKGMTLQGYLMAILERHLINLGLISQVSVEKDEACSNEDSNVDT